MKIYTLLVICIATLLSSCSDDNSNSTFTENYQPLNVGTYWNYSVQTANSTENDSLYIENETTVGTETYANMRVGELPTGFYSSTLNNNSLRYSGGKTFVTGSSNLDLGGVIPFNITLDDFIIFDANASNNQELSLLSGTVEQNIEGFPLQLSYVLRSVAGENISTFTTPDGNQYQNVKKVSLKLNLKITTINDDLGFPITIEVLAPQDVIVSERMYAPNIGMVYSTTTFSYELQDFSQYGIELPIPQTGSEIQFETLESYNVD